LRVRGLPKKDYGESKLKELFKNIIDEYINTKPKEEQPKLKRKKLLIQAKIMLEDGVDKNSEEIKSKVFFITIFTKT